MYIYTYIYIEPDVRRILGPPTTNPSEALQNVTADSILCIRTCDMTDLLLRHTEFTNMMWTNTRHTS